MSTRKRVICVVVFAVGMISLAARFEERREEQNNIDLIYEEAAQANKFVDGMSASEKERANARIDAARKLRDIRQQNELIGKD